jgi:hypothetical protein
LVQVQQLAAEGHKASLSDISEAFQYIMRETAKRIYLGYQTQILNGENTVELEATMGELNMMELELSALGDADFDIGIEMLPTLEEITQIKLDLNELAANGMIAPEDKFSVARVAKESTLKAEQLLTHLSKRFRAEAQQNQQANIQAQNEGLAQVAQAKIEMEAQKEAQKQELEAANQKQKYDLEGRNTKNDWVEKSKFEMLQTENKIKLIKVASEAKKGETADADTRKLTSDPGMISPGAKASENSLMPDAIPRIAGDVTPSLGIPEGIGAPPNVETGTPAI